LYKAGFNADFQGNLMFCSELQLSNFRPTKFFDLTSAVAIAYFLVNGETPIMEYMRQNPKVSCNDETTYRKIRLLNSRRFEMDYSSQEKNPFYALYRYLFSKRDSFMLQSTMQAGAANHVIDYEYILYLIPQEDSEKSLINLHSFCYRSRD